MIGWMTTNKIRQRVFLSSWILLLSAVVVKVSCTLIWLNWHTENRQYNTAALHLLLALYFPSLNVCWSEKWFSEISKTCKCDYYCFLGIVTREMFDRMQNADIISHLTKEFNEVSRVWTRGLCKYKWNEDFTDFNQYLKYLNVSCMCSVL